MQDRFKFRAWDNQERYYIPDEETNFCHGMMEYWLDKEDCPLVFEQCTGLKDKNGKLIYEGDVVSLVPEIEKIKYVVKWDEYNAQLFLGALNKRVRIDFKTIDLKLEVVGNIHENPELLEVTND